MFGVFPERAALGPSRPSELAGANGQRAPLEDERPSKDQVVDQERAVIRRPIQDARDALIEGEAAAGEEDQNSDEERPEEPVLAMPEGMFIVRSSLRGA